MDRKRLWTGLGIAVLCGLFLAMFVNYEIRKASIPAPVIVMKQIVVAAGPLPLGTVLTSKDLRVIPWPSGAPVANMFSRVEDCENRALITSVVLNEPILESKLAPTAAGGGLAATIPEGMRAISASVNDVVAVAGFVTPGAMVDVLATGATKDSGNVTKTVLENVRVLAANQRIESLNGRPQNVAVITLLVTPEDAAKVVMASNSGKIQLALRNTIDSAAANPAPVLQASIYALDAAPPTEHHYVPPAPKATPPPPMAVDVISGSKRETKTFANPDKSKEESNGPQAESH
jgi:pilus assembly protein CpaB